MSVKSNVSLSLPQFCISFYCWKDFNPFRETVNYYVGIFVLIKHFGNYFSITLRHLWEVWSEVMQALDIVLHTLEVCLGNM